MENRKKRGHQRPALCAVFICIALAFYSSGSHPAQYDSSFRQNFQEEAAESRLAAILKKSAEYCHKLDRAALDFVCLEEVTEMTRFYTPHTDVYLYDYQFIRNGRETEEKRNLISVNGEKTNIRDSSLDTVMFQYKNVLFGPVGLLSQAWQAYHDYRFIGEEVINGEKVVVVEATPNAFLVTPHCYGRVWIREEDGSVLKIVWDQRSLGNFRAVEEWAKLHEAEPRITAYSEYGVEKNGLRFPSRSYTENAFIEKNDRKLVNAEISIFYKSYKFFTVETEVKYE